MRKRLERLLDEIDGFLHTMEHASDCTYRSPGAACDCGKGDAFAFLGELSEAIDTFLTRLGK